MTFPKLPDEYDPFWRYAWDGLSYLHDRLWTLVEKSNYMPLKHLLADYIVQSVSTTVQHFILRRPQECEGPFGPPLRQITCECEYCSILQGFLDDPSRLKDRWNFPSHIRSHLSGQLNKVLGLFVNWNQKTPMMKFILRKTERTYADSLLTWKNEVDWFILMLQPSWIGFPFIGSFLVWIF